MRGRDEDTPANTYRGCNKVLAKQKYFKEAAHSREQRVPPHVEYINFAVHISVNTPFLCLEAFGLPRSIYTILSNLCLSNFLCAFILPEHELNKQKSDKVNEIITVM